MNPTACFKHSNPLTHHSTYTHTHVHTYAHTHTLPSLHSPTPSLKSKRKNIVKLRGLNPDTCDVETVRKIFHDHHSVTNVTFDKDGTARIMFADRKTAKVRKRETDETERDEVRDGKRDSLFILNIVVERVAGYGVVYVCCGARCGV
jgi:hypothetical protein